jgi:hypothetical protein
MVPAWTAARGLNIVANAEAETNRVIFDAYKDAGGPETAKLGFSRYIVVAKDAAEAEGLMVPAFAYWRSRQRTHKSLLRISDL